MTLLNQHPTKKVGVIQQKEDIHNSHNNNTNINQENKEVVVVGEVDHQEVIILVVEITVVLVKDMEKKVDMLKNINQLHLTVVVVQVVVVVVVVVVVEVEDLLLGLPKNCQQTQFTLLD